MLTAQLDLFNVPAAPAQHPAPRPDAMAQLAHRARAELDPRASLYRPAAGHRSANLQMYGIRGHWLSLCPMPLRARYRTAYLNPTREPSPC